MPGMERWQLMQEYAQKSTRFTLPARSPSARGRSPGVLSQALTPSIRGSCPQWASSSAPSTHVPPSPTPVLPCSTLSVRAWSEAV